MIFIRENNPEKLRIETPRSVYRMQGIIFTAVGLLPTVGIIMDSESPFYAAVVPFLVFLGGITLLIFARKPDYIEVDRMTRKVTLKLHDGVFDRKPPREISFAEIRETRLGSGSTSSRSTKGIDFILLDGSEIQATPYVSRKKRAEKAYEVLHSVMGK